MKISKLSFFAVLFAGLSLSASASTIGVVNYNDPQVAIFGTGNPDGSYTSATSSSGVEVGLRFKERGTGNMSNDGMGTYTFAIGTTVNIEFSLDSSGASMNLSNYTSQLSIDTDPGPGVMWVSFDPMLAFPDNSWGTSTTLNSGGVEGTALALAGSNSVMQNSQRDIWLSFHPASDATYDMSFAVYDANGTTGVPIARTEARLQIGNGASSVPDTGSTLFMLGLGCLGLMTASKKSRHARGIVLA